MKYIVSIASKYYATLTNIVLIIFISSYSQTLAGEYSLFLSLLVIFTLIFNYGFQNKILTIFSGYSTHALLEGVSRQAYSKIPYIGLFLLILVTFNKYASNVDPIIYFALAAGWFNSLLINYVSIVKIKGRETVGFILELVLKNTCILSLIMFAVWQDIHSILFLMSLYLIAVVISLACGILVVKSLPQLESKSSELSGSAYLRRSDYVGVNSVLLSVIENSAVIVSYIFVNEAMAGVLKISLSAVLVLAQSSIPLNQIIGIKLAKLDMSIKSFQYTVREKLIARYNFIFVCALFTIFSLCCFAIPVIANLVSLHCVLVFILSGIVTVYTGPLVYAVNIASLDKLLFKTLCVAISFNVLFILAAYFFGEVTVLMLAFQYAATVIGWRLFIYISMKKAVGYTTPISLR